jgi:hypothetical protein
VFDSCHDLVAVRANSLTAMQAAFEILGIGPVYHGEDIFFQSLEIDMMLRGIEAKYLPVVGRVPGCQRCAVLPPEYGAHGGISGGQGCPR